MGLGYNDIQTGMAGFEAVPVPDGTPAIASRVQSDGSLKKYEILGMVYHKGEVITEPSASVVAPYIEFTLGSEL